MKVIPFLQLQPDGYVLFRDYATGDLAQVDLLLDFIFLDLTENSKAHTYYPIYFLLIIIYKTMVNKNRTNCIGINEMVLQIYCQIRTTGGKKEARIF